MTDQLTKALALSGIAILGLLLWALSIALVLRDVNRRHLPGYEQTAWLALAALLPIIGGVGYLFSRILERLFSPHSSKALEPEDRLTADKPPDKLAIDLPTIAAADLVRQPEVKPDQAVRALKDAGRSDSLCLEVVSGPLAGRKFIIEALPARIGRGPMASLSLDEDIGISRHHAEIYESEGVLRIRDLQSTHGTSLNGKNITDEKFDPGDRLVVGQSTLLLRKEALDGEA